MVLLQFANGFSSFGYLQISFAFFLTLHGPLSTALDAVPLFLPRCVTVGGGGRAGREGGELDGRGASWTGGGRAGRGRRGGGGRTGIRRGGADWHGLGCDTEGLSEVGGSGAFLLTVIDPGLFLLLRHESALGPLPLMSAWAFSSSSFSSSPTASESGARGAVITFGVTSLEQAALLVISLLRLSSWKFFRDSGRDNFLLSSFVVSFLLKILWDNYEDVMNSCY